MASIDTQKTSLHSRGILVLAQSDFAFDLLVRRKEKNAARWIAGVDEAGRGPLAGPVVAAAVILNPRRRIQGIGDSKTICAEERERLAALIRQRAVAWSVAWADVAEIDSLNILQATFLAMRRAICGLRIAPDHVQIDGNRAPSMVEMGIRCQVQTIVKGDALIESIGAASILAKTVRDAMMARLDSVYPGYQLARHKGYGTASHHAALKQLGPSAIHRRSFEPVRVATLPDETSEHLQLAFSNDELDESEALAMSEG